MDHPTGTSRHGAKKTLNLGRWTEKELGSLIADWAKIEELSARIGVISEQFLGVEYGESTLVGGVDTPEVLVINLERVDCFTLIDYVEAMRLSRSFGQFTGNLARVRYRAGEVSYLGRNHFFTDWPAFNEKYVSDVTGTVGGPAAEKTKKTLNLKDDGTYFLDGIARLQREIVFIPTGSVSERVVAKLHTGDYAGIYTEKAGLDVSHVGIIIKHNGATLLRHASSLSRRVIDQDLKGYLADKPGLVIVRPKNQA